MSTYKGTIYHGIKLDLENNIYWFQPDKLENLKKQEIKNYKLGQKLDIRDLWKRYKNSELSFGFGKEVEFNFEDITIENRLNGVLETIVTDIDCGQVQVEYFRCNKLKRAPIDVDDFYPCIKPFSGINWPVDCLFRDTFILKGEQRQLVVEDNFSVYYDLDGFILTIQIGSMKLEFNVQPLDDGEDYYEEYEVLGWQIEEKDDCTILSVDLQARYFPSLLEELYQPYDVNERHEEAEARIEEAEAEDEECSDDENDEDEWEDVTTFDGECSVVVKFPGKPKLNYNYNGLISVGDKVMVSGKLAGLVGTVVRIEEPWEGEYVQNVVEIVESGNN